MGNTRKLWYRIISVLCVFAMILPWMPEKAKASPDPKIEYLEDRFFDWKGGLITAKVGFGNSDYEGSEITYSWI